ncbi:radical SAM protein [Amycolatopsis sp. NBC_01307]|uniref:radical SAM protein n=1 Tax=Amycolatopsis sp. NBC_01307 TaxID=2903561 RepID=UPI002E0D4C90|nr:radical SAM protein [Amycolatopsis sp. NBC_01307]
MHRVIATPFQGEFLLLHPGKSQGLKIPEEKFEQLRALGSSELCPEWLTGVAQRTWGLDIRDQKVGDVTLVRSPSSFNYGQASYELNLGCNYDCKHCYLGMKEFEGLPWTDRVDVLHALRDAGVVWLQLTGGEPMIDQLFTSTYSYAFSLGMMIEVLTNGSRLHNPIMLDLLAKRPPQKLTLSVYGATEETYDGLTQRRGSYKAFSQGLAAVHEAGLPLELSIIVTSDNAHEVDAMHALAEKYGLPSTDFANISPTIYGGSDVLRSQYPQHLTKRSVFTGCDAGNTFFHVDPHGNASTCKVARDPKISLVKEGVEGLRRLGGIADGLLLRQGGCTGCQLSGTCGTCMPLASLFRKAKAPLANYCQHTEKRKEVDQ